jgi:flagellar basal-body rod modification protein FlgD
MANNISALVKDGEIQKSTASSISLSSEKANSSSNLDKDAFLQLLVAQMKYQDPLEPTDNTEYISQLATFSQLEEMQNLSATMSFQRAGTLVGQEVICKVTNSQTGNTEYAQGIVDYVVYEGNKAYISIDEELYSVDDVYQVIDAEYSQAYNLGKKFVTALASLPDLRDLTLDYEEAIGSLRQTYDEMNAYQKGFISEDALNLLKSYEDRVHELKLAAEATTPANDPESGPDA